ncbi:hypothetical protein L4C38_04665 [Vibrio kasasachensis]|uniref:hypothetical protein n=1 Tax=Vibrio kasasachensis TaxID=2910248 RepID=UPI003D0EE8B8
MYHKVGLASLLFLIIIVTVLAVFKGADDYLSQSRKNHLVEFEPLSNNEMVPDLLGAMEPLPLVWVPFNDHETYGLYYSWLAFNAKGNPTLVEHYNHLSSVEFESQQMLKPLDSKVVIFRANQMWREGGSFDDVLAQFKLAQRLGNFEKLTLMESLNFYLSNWPELTVADKKIAISYLLDHEKYAMKIWQFDDLLKKPIVGGRACSLLKFNGLTPYYCRK